MKCEACGEAARELGWAGMVAKSRLIMPLAWRIVWLVLGVPAALLFSLGLMLLINPATFPYRDLTQDWLAARCYSQGWSVYTPHTESSNRFLGRSSDDWNIKINAHPPVCVLALLPLGLLEHHNALLTWNLLSLAMLAAAVWIIFGSWGLDCDSWYRLAAYCVLISSTALAMQVRFAQLNSALALLTVLAWVCDRHNKAAFSGVFVGLAAGVKLFPAYLLLYFLCTARWKALVWAAGTILVLHAAAMVILGPQDFMHYFRDVMPQVSAWRSYWWNCSLTGYWSRLFDVTDGATREWFHAPWLATMLIYASNGAVTAAIAWRTWNARTVEQRDMAFAAAVVGMLLVSPITWDHYMLLLLLPFALLWYYAATTAGFQALLAALVFITGFLPPPLLWERFLKPTSVPLLSRIADPWHALVILPFYTYSLLVLLVLALMWRGGRASEATRTATA